MPPLAIVGAGAAGLAAAHALRSAEPALAVTVFEKSRGVSGRAATRWRDAPDARGEPFRWRYDHGAQYASPDAGSRAHRLMTETLDASGLVDLGGAVWPFDDDGTLRPDRARQDPGPRLTYRDGIAEIGRRLRDATPGLDLRLQTRVGALARDHGLWRLTSDEGADLGAFDAVLLTPPAPQTADLLRTGTMPGDLRQRLMEALAPAAYRSQFTVVLAFTGPVPRPEPYALVNAAEHGASGGGHAVAWLAVESDKPGRAPEGATILLAQMSPRVDRGALRRRARGRRARGHARGGRPPRRARSPSPPGPTPSAGATRCRTRAPTPSALHAASGDGLFFAGDAIAGKGRVHLALESGLDAADRILAAL